MYSRTVKLYKKWALRWPNNIIVTWRSKVVHTSKSYIIMTLMFMYLHCFGNVHNIKHWLHIIMGTLYKIMACLYSYYWISYFVTACAHYSDFIVHCIVNIMAQLVKFKDVRMSSHIKEVRYLSLSCPQRQICEGSSGPNIYVLCITQSQTGFAQMLHACTATHQEAK